MGEAQAQPKWACLVCRAGKRRCDKRVPSCTRCWRLQIRCVYRHKGEGGTAAAAAAPFDETLSLQRVDAKVPFPVRGETQMPMLLHSFIETFGMALLPVDDGSLAFLLRTAWVSRALADPCFFHATLFAASAHLDALRSVPSTSATLYHHTMALRLIHGKLALPEGMVDEGTIACIAPLVFFSSMSSDERSSRIHRRGLMQMIRVKGGLQKMDLGGFFSALIPVCVMTEAIIFDSALDIPGVEIPPTPAKPPTFLVSAVLERATRETGFYTLSDEAIKIFKDIHTASRDFNDFFPSGSLDRPLSELTRIKWLNRVQRRIKRGFSTPDNPQLPTTNAIDECCGAAALVFWYILDDTSPIDPMVLEYLVADLKTALLKTPVDTWIRRSPDAHAWICLVGAAAAARDSNDRAWFSLLLGQSIICIRSEGAGLYLEGWKMYDWLNRRRKRRVRWLQQQLVK
ncbi:Zn(II)2Cys6 transcription factor domain-containing protein [Aspergillus clavatus NRRL 1]|uniref:C6 zinc finger domain protein n=1 Tax=Aspergillus clavatus (strain ATCC 1007 / CBS 513.65 / DSM 816 / NCTC 3887 / NRRL 1 / QM 1276 / 107) TaxID=344612 RepID=A1CDF9_ASPCL|nr:C6 zinc finger domain protein [Aspergillus clavatus NRRL 1]EAW11886.1 C6 zinc finger domain protein [Aspergillus clavatus NRRL 1]